MSDSDNEPSRDFREAAALLADTLLHIEAIVTNPGPDPMRAVRTRIQEAKEGVKRCGFTLVELYHYMYLYIGMTEAEMRIEMRKYEHVSRGQS